MPTGIITGASRGLGLALATALAQDGWRLVIDARGADALQDAAARIGGDVIAIPGDVADAAHRLDLAAAAGPQVDLLVNNASLLGPSPQPALAKYPLGTLHHVFAVNVTGQYLCTVAVLPALRQALYGKIVNICSTCFDKGTPVGLAPYIAAKGGSLGLTRALAHELGPHNITVNAVSPGFIPVDTPKAVHDPEAAEALRRRVAQEQAIHRTGVPEDLCGTIEFLCSADSDFVTGQVFNVDGGWTHH